ncbi:ABC transporter ATP-binding protein [Anaerovibrio slackiae]|uniref:ABC transporter ATP-binding protein n=1 Tax=Anaerovibrio slackiae TaxID=2652309 RepID=UPI00197CB45F|nr:ABC transporter ATP-binding protein [Anaerovibrio slackiae]
MSEDWAIKIEHLSKVYKIFDKPTDRVKEALNPFRKRYSRDFYALNDVSLTIKKGETVGIIGKNGAGKSTILKIITGVLTPTSGSVQVNGRIASLLELGAGFDPEMTGIENIYMNGTIMGYNKEEMDDRLQDIIDFADIGEFIHQPVKMYSSGMFARLAFAVNAFVEPDILIVDEALSVGDMKFQKKCTDKIEALRENGTTILFCSHDMHAVNELCNCVYWFRDGKIAKSGEPSSVISEYMVEFAAGFSIRGNGSNPNYYVRNSDLLSIDSVHLFDKNRNSRELFVQGDDIYCDINFTTYVDICSPIISIIIFRKDKLPVAINKSSFQKYDFGMLKKGQNTIRCILKNIPLNLGEYTVGVSVWNKESTISYANNTSAVFRVKTLNILYGPTEERSVFFLCTDWN